MELFKVNQYNHRNRSGGEWPENEIIASHLDFAIGFNRTPPSVMRNITSSYLRQVIEKQSGVLSSMMNSKLLILEQLTQTCADNGVFFGAMIGWYVILLLK